MGAHVRAAQDVRTAAQVATRAAGDVVIDRHVNARGLLEGDAAAHRAVGEAGVGADHALIADGRAPPEHGHGEKDRVAPDGHVRADPGGRRVDDGDALVHEARVDAVARDGRELGELGAAVHAEELVGVLGAHGGHALAVTAQDLHHVRDVVLVLDVGGGELADVGRELGAVEGVEAGVARGEARGLLGRAVLLLDDARHVALGVELEPAVAKGVGGRPGEDGLGGAVVDDGLGQATEGLALNERAVTVQDEHRALVDARPLERHANGVARAQPLGLLDALDVLLAC